MEIKSTGESWAQQHLRHQAQVNAQKEQDSLRQQQELQQANEARQLIKKLGPESLAAIKQGLKTNVDELVSLDPSQRGKLSYQDNEFLVAITNQENQNQVVIELIHIKDDDGIMLPALRLRVANHRDDKEIVLLPKLQKGLPGKSEILWVFENTGNPAGMASDLVEALLQYITTGRLGFPVKSY